MDPRKPEDLFACTIVVENKARVAEAEKLITDLFTFDYKRPRDPKITHLAPHSFDFDDLRLYVKWKDDPKNRPTGLDGMVFEVQIKTYLQHAWGIATHDFIYKGDEVEWATSRIAFQVRAMLENAELSIGEVKKLTDSAMLDRCDRICKDLRDTIGELKSRWEESHLPDDLRRLAHNVLELSRILQLPIAVLWQAVDEATASGEGSKTLNLSPYGAILQSLLKKYDAGLLKPLEHPKCRDKLFVPHEVILPTVSATITERIIRPPAAASSSLFAAFLTVATASGTNMAGPDESNANRISAWISKTDLTRFQRCPYALYLLDRV
jgi:hypothetical protein